MQDDIKMTVTTTSVKGKIYPMSNELRKGKRTAAKISIKKAEKKMKQFSKALFMMNSVYYAVKDNPNLNPDTAEDLIKASTSHEFTEEQLEILVKDLLNQEDESEDNTK